MIHRIIVNDSVYLSSTHPLTDFFCHLVKHSRIQQTAAPYAFYLLWSLD